MESSYNDSWATSGMSKKQLKKAHKEREKEEKLHNKKSIFAHSSIKILFFLVCGLFFHCFSYFSLPVLGSLLTYFH